MRHHKDHRKHGLKKFFLLVLVLLAYAIFVVTKFGIAEGFSATFLTWAFFVLCTPIADAGFLVDFPVRLILGLRMFISELVVWGIAITGSLLFLFINPDAFSSIGILHLFHTVLTEPWPLWGLIIISAAGTFLSIRTGDDVYEFIKIKKSHAHISALQKKRLIIELSMFVIALLAYVTLLTLTGIEIDAQ